MRRLCGHPPRVAGVGGESNRGVLLDRPFDPPIAPHSSIVQIGPFRGQLLLVRNHFVSGGTVQLYAACYDCIVAENEFEEFGFDVDFEVIFMVVDRIYL